MPRRLTTALLAAAAIGGPYVATETDLGRNTTQQASSWLRSGSVAGGGAQNVAQSSTEGPYHAHYQTETLWGRVAPNDHEAQVRESGKVPVSLVGGPVHDLRDVLRFDISPAWVSQHFARVTTVLADLQLDGLRVPLVTGTQPHDVAGTVTYYFDHGGTLQRVNIHGFVGDPTQIMKTMQKHYGMQPEPTLDAGVYTVRWNGVHTGLLKLTRAPVMYSTDQHEKYTVFLELNEPNTPYGLSPAAQQIVRADNYTGRW